MAIREGSDATCGQLRCTFHSLHNLFVKPRHDDNIMAEVLWSFPSRGLRSSWRNKANCDEQLHACVTCVGTVILPEFLAVQQQSLLQARAVALSQESDHHAFVVAAGASSLTAIDISDPAGQVVKQGVREVKCPTIRMRAGQATRDMC